jgi:hypothetical protein
MSSGHKDLVLSDHNESRRDHSINEANLMTRDGKRWKR